MKLILLLLVAAVAAVRADGQDQIQGQGQNRGQGQGHPEVNSGSRIPNGRRVPNPCGAPGSVWAEVGYRDTRGGESGGGQLNPFGYDLARLGGQWSKALCRADSDGDGLTNGQELGDPTCIWREGDIPQQTDHITHPGICDPWNSTRCASKNAWLNCDDAKDFKCDSIREQDVSSLELRFPRTQVPTGDTVRRCSVFDVPSDQPYHIIASEPIIDNSDAVLRMVAYACDDTVEVSKEATVCPVSPEGCSEPIAFWTTGKNSGSCFHKNAGFRFGRGAAKRVLLQIHWSNTLHANQGWYDASGMRLYYTPRLRPNDAATMVVGQSYLEIPPGVPSLTLAGSCSSGCTSRFFKGPLFVTAEHVHMHGLGVSGHTEVIRYGRVINKLNNYSYAIPVEILPGDELKTNFGGDCTQWKETDLCVFNDPEIKAALSRAFNVSVPRTAAVFQKVEESCSVYGVCRKECQQVLTEIRAAQPVYGGELWEFVKTQMWENRDMNHAPILRFLSAIDTCDRRASQSPDATSSCPPMTSPAANLQHGPQTGTSNISSNVLQLIKLLGNRPLLQNIIFNVNNNNNNNNKN
ncbi:uncharacterized protein LOC143275807 [Babylonia areolata]|uniref:uncharacterized protein LOC143275807 n=1 Tax=Babylonia areolata TaxID=304850 RepID=UPI003FD4746E